MDRNSLYVLILVLGAAIGIAYVSKTKGGIDKIFTPATERAQDGWMKDDPGWDKMPQPKVEVAPPTPPQEPTPPPAPKTQPQQKRQVQPINRPPQSCPPNG